MRILYLMMLGLVFLNSTTSRAMDGVASLGYIFGLNSDGTVKLVFEPFFKALTDIGKQEKIYVTDRVVFFKNIRSYYSAQEFDFGVAFEKNNQIFCAVTNTINSADTDLLEDCHLTPAQESSIRKEIQNPKPVEIQLTDLGFKYESAGFFTAYPNMDAFAVKTNPDGLITLGRLVKYHQERIDSFPKLKVTKSQLITDKQGAPESVEIILENSWIKLAANNYKVGLVAFKKDLAQLTHEEFKLEDKLVAKDPSTGFLYYGKNSTQIIDKVTTFNGVSVDQIGKDLKDCGLVEEFGGGYLMPDEKLIPTLVMDNQFVVDQEKQDHLKWIAPLEILLKISHDLVVIDDEVTFPYNGSNYGVDNGYLSLCYEKSLFGDGAFRSGGYVTLKRYGNDGKVVDTIKFPLMLIHYIQRYGFYGGEKSPIRISPEKIKNFFN